jgi:hypothetical protein
VHMTEHIMGSICDAQSIQQGDPACNNGTYRTESLRLPAGHLPASQDSCALGRLREGVTASSKEHEVKAGERGVPEDPCLAAGSAHCSLAGEVQRWQGRC